MFTILQKRMKLIFILILVPIIVTFMFFGMGFLKNTKKVKIVGRAFDKDITHTEFLGHLRAVHMLLFLRYPLMQLAGNIFQ